MKNSELNTLWDLLVKLRRERMDEYRDDGYDVDQMSEEELYDLDDGDCLLQGLDNTISCVENIHGEKDDDKPTVEEMKRVLQYLDEVLLVEGTFDEVCEYVNKLKDD